MRISRKSEYALRALLAFARGPGSIQLQELSRSENIPIKFLEQILIALRHAGYLSSKRGATGGYTLRIPANRITVGEIIRLMDGPIAPVPCAAEQPVERCTCPDPRTCPLRLFMTEIRSNLSAALHAQTIDDMLRLRPQDAALAFDI
jgi:Rrf2 family protein